MDARAYFHDGVQDVRKRRLCGDVLAVQLKFAGRSGGNNVGFSRWQGCSVRRAHDLSGFFGTQRKSRNQSEPDGDFHLRIRTNERSISAILLTPAIPISMASSARSTSITRATPR